MVDKPFKIIEKTELYEIREFKDFEPHNLFWHRDAENRLIELLEGDIMVQLDNELPLQLEVGENVYIEKNVYHRAIARDYFKIKIYYKE